MNKRKGPNICKPLPVGLKFRFYFCILLFSGAMAREEAAERRVRNSEIPVLGRWPSCCLGRRKVKFSQRVRTFSKRPLRMRMSNHVVYNSVCFILVFCLETLTIEVRQGARKLNFHPGTCSPLLSTNLKRRVIDTVNRLNCIAELEDCQ